MRLTVILTLVACLNAIRAYDVFVDQANGQCDTLSFSCSTKTAELASLGLDSSTLNGKIFVLITTGRSYTRDTSTLAYFFLLYSKGHYKP